MIVSDVVLPIRYSEEDLFNALKRKVKHVKVRNVTILKRSVDARKKPDLKFVLTVSVNEPDRMREPVLPEKTVYGPYVPGTDCSSLPLLPIEPVVIAGSGPAGLLSALTLLRYRIPVTVVERGGSVEERIEKTEKFFLTGSLDKDTNVQFGEGGAGTFSDGKLNTGNKRTVDHETVLRTFREFGAPDEILYDAKPHIGTDNLTKVVRNMRSEIERLGGTVRFHATLTGFSEDASGAVTSVELNHQETVRTSALILAIGHSARDTFELLLRKNVRLTKKPFAVGLRIEHPESDITISQYGTKDFPELKAAPYKLTHRASSQRGVYSFCMCPGGYVVNASSEEGHTVVNGMSLYARDSCNSNSAIVVQVTPEDFPGDSVLSGIDFQRELERKAYDAGSGKIPVQTFADFINHQKTSVFSGVVPCTKGVVEPSDLNLVLPEFLCRDITESILSFGKTINGFDRPDAVLSAVESRTSSPVRIERDDSFMASVKGLFPAGEGAGYAGGILSSAVDGIHTADAVFDYLTKGNPAV